jgi:hypothetical protein
VRLRFEQHCGIIDSDINVAHYVRGQHSKWSSPGILPDWQSWGQCRTDDSDDNRIAARGAGVVGTKHANRYTSRFVCDDKHYPVKTLFICERERP